MDELFIYIIVSSIFFMFLFYLSGLKEGGILSIFAIVIALSWLLIERIVVNKEFDVISFYIFLVNVFLIIVLFWLRKKFILDEKRNNKKKKKKKEKQNN